MQPEHTPTMAAVMTSLMDCVWGGPARCELAAGSPGVILGACVAAAVGVVAARRLSTSFLTLRALAPTPLVSRWISGWARTLDYSGDDFFRADGARTPWTDIRRRGLERLAETLAERHPKSLAWGDRIREAFSDLRFTDANRVPFPFVRGMRERFNLATVVTQSQGPRLKDLDGEWSLDVSGSYGVNVAGFDRYKQWIHEGWDLVKDLGPVLGPLHPIVADNLAMLKRVSSMDEISFHMSGTEAVMAAVRLVRFNTRRKLIVCFSGAYHGWWDGVLPGLGNDRRIDDCLTLRDMDRASLAVIRRRASEIAGVLVNPVQSFHPNSPPPNDAVLLTNAARKTEASTDPYAHWLRELRQVCAASGVPLILDEVYTGFRLAPGGAQEYFDIEADMVVYGKTVAGGLPVGVVCGKRELMKRFDPRHPMRLAYVVGTFSAHPAVMGSMNAFLRWLLASDTAARYEEMNRRCADWVAATNRDFVDERLPLRVGNLGTVWTVMFTEPGRYHWLLQYYLRAEGVTLSWVGTGRCLTSMDFTTEDYAMLQDRLLRAARSMKHDGWWLDAEQHPERDKQMRRRLVGELFGSLVHVPAPLERFYGDVMNRKHDDHHASHNDFGNQMLHLLSSSVFIYCYFRLFSDLTTAMYLGLAALFVRQFGHAILEPACHEEEKLLLGYSTRNKTIIVMGYLLSPITLILQQRISTIDALTSMIPAVAQQWFVWTLLVVFGRVLYLAWKHNVRASLVWYVKLVTDPITDILTYFPRRAVRA